MSFKVLNSSWSTTTLCNRHVWDSALLTSVPEHSHHLSQEEPHDDQQVCELSWADGRNSGDPVRRCCSSWTGVSICQADSAPSSDNSFCLSIAEVGGASQSERKVLWYFFQPSESRRKSYSDGAFRCCWICLNHCYRNHCSGCNLWCCWNVLYYAGMWFCQP